MKFFSGFGFQNEEGLFEPLLIQNDYTVAGFSYGAIRAFEYALASLERIDTLQLLSPAFFQNRDAKFKRLQKMGYKKDSQAYMDTFYANVCGECVLDIDSFKAKTTVEDLDVLLEYVWNPEELERVRDKGTRIEVYLGGKDRIVDSQAAHEFFRQYGTSWLLKSAGHLLV